MDTLGGREDANSVSVEAAQKPVFRYATNEEALAAFEATRHLHDRCYRELAKGPGAPPSIEELIEAAERELAAEADAAPVRAGVGWLG